MKRKYDPVDLSAENLRKLFRSYEPKGSGPLSVMRMVCRLLEEIAILKGIDLYSDEG